MNLPFSGIRHASSFACVLACAALASIACGSGEPAPVPVAAEDVSILFPLPVNERDRTLLDFRDLGKYGRILPQYAIDALPPLADADQADWAWTQIRVVAVRVDPCFGASTDGPSCRNQIRLVWQPLQNTSERGDVVAMDAAVHTTYEVPRDDLVAFVEKVRSLGGRVAKKELGIHSVLVEQGLDGPFATGVKEALLGILGDERLTRVGFMTMPVTSKEWIFGVFDVKDHQVVPSKPAGIAEDRQTLQGTNAEDGAPTLTVSSVGLDDVRAPLLGPATPPTDETAYRAFLAAVRLENPHLKNSENADCASCHLAGPARIVLESRWKFDTRGPLVHDSDLTTPAKTPRSFRGFGYFGAAPSVSTRVANETSDVARLVGSILASRGATAK